MPSFFSVTLLKYSSRFCFFFVRKKKWWWLCNLFYVFWFSPSLFISVIHDISSSGVSIWDILYCFSRLNVLKASQLIRSVTVTFTKCIKIYLSQSWAVGCDSGLCGRLTCACFSKCHQFGIFLRVIPTPI